MFSVKSIPSTTSVLSMYTTFTASAMLVRSVVSEVQTMASQFIPEQLQTLLRSKCRSFWGNPSSQMTLLIDEYNGYTINELYQACEIYLGTKITSSVDKLKVSKGPREKNLSINIDKDEIVNDVFEDVQLKWQMSCMETKEASRQGKYEKRLIELSFHKKFLEVVVNSYLPYVLERSKAIEKENQGVKLYSLGNCCDEYPANLDHPATFETLAMDPTLKKELIDDLDRFVRRRDFYKRVGKTWKRGYLLYGPPGTGKSSLIAAMANYLKYSIYDLELASIYSNSDLRRLLVSTKNRSMLVIEDIDCSIEFNDREAGNTNNSDSQLTLSGLLNFIDGLWSSCGDERIIVFTTNHRDKLDPALLRPGRMDMHIHMSYCTPDGFRILASNYLGINSHDLFAEIDELIKEVVKVTPAEVAEELMKSEDADVALAGLIKFLENKKSGSCDSDSDQRVGSKRETTGIITNGNSKKASKKRKPKRSKA